MNCKKEKKKIYLLFLVIVALTVACYLTTYPNALPLYQLELFTISTTTYGIILNGTMIFACILVCTKLIMDYKDNNLISTLIILDVNILYFIPGFLMNAIYATETYFMNYYAGFWFVLMIMHWMIRYIGKRDNRIITMKIDFSTYRWFYNVGIVVVFSAFALGVSLIYSNWKISLTSLLDLNEVLASRAASAELNIHWIIWYPVLCASMILPIWYTLAYRNKRYWQMALIIITVIAMYSIGSNRMFLFLLFFAVIFCAFKDDNLLIVKVTIIMLFLVFLENYLNTGYPIMGIARRLFVTTNGESRLYARFFENNDVDWCRQLLERWLLPLGIKSPYLNRIPAVIGQTYLNGSNCNNGLVGYSIANYGSAGIVIAPFLYSISFRLLDIIMKKVKYNKMLQVTAIVISLHVINSFGWTEYLILPSFLLLFYILMFFMPSVKADDIKVKNIIEHKSD